MDTVQFHHPFEHIYERDIDLLLMEEFWSSQKFTDFFCSQINITNYQVISVQHSLSDASGESDVTVILEGPNGRLGLLIEDKVDAAAMPEQHDRYHTRGQHLIEQGIITKYYIFLVAPAAYISSNGEARKYQHTISFEDLADFFVRQGDKRSEYKASMLRQAIQQKRAGYIPIEDKAVTAFWGRYYAFHEQYYPHLVLNKYSGPRGSSAAWATFRTDEKGVEIWHKANMACVDLMLPKLGSFIKELKVELSDLLDADMSVVNTGKSASIRIKIENGAIDFQKPFDDYLDVMKQSLDAVDRLYQLSLRIPYKELRNKYVKTEIKSTKK